MPRFSNKTFKRRKFGANYKDSSAYEDFNKGQEQPANMYIKNSSSNSKFEKPSSDPEHPDYVPSIFASMKNKGSSSSVNRYNRQVKRREMWNAPLTEIENEPPILKLDTKEVDCQTDLTFQEISEMEKCTRDKLCEHLAFRFKISKSAASSIFKEWVRRLAEVLKKHIRVPSKQQYRRRVPAKFLKENWSRVTALIDCSEIFIDRAFNLDARALTFSQYKSHNTVKFLIACTPLGKVSFVSKLYGGRTSDKQIIQLSGFLEQIRPGDEIFADRGFPVKDLVAERGY
ncbi:uncharacterized protein TNCV_1429001 [Trichonephila clavipes]|nr:uncharacterized protein TNCV_1429001 [Trichonephila clavipes]